MRVLFAISALLGVTITACGNAGSSENELHPVESVTIVYKQEGAQSGKAIMAHDRHANLRYEENDLMLNMMGMKKVQKDWTVYRDGRIYRGDPARKTITDTENPIDEDLQANMKDRSPEETAMMFIGAMGAEKNGKKGEFAGEPCDYYNAAQVNMLFCMTADFLVIYQKISMGPMSLERTAISIERGNPGPLGADTYKIPRDGYKVVEGPDLNNILNGIGQ